MANESERADFMRQICTNPRCDTTRLVFADWLEEHGGEPERAEFIRLQYDLTRSPVCCYRPGTHGEIFATCGCATCDLARKERKMLAAHGTKWFPGLSEYVNWNQHPQDVHGKVETRTGFVSQLTCTAETWHRIAWRLTWHPSVKTRCAHGCFEFGRDRYVIYNPNKRRNGSAIIICPVCGGEGYQHKPVMDTTQPIERVTLTTLPHNRDGPDPLMVWRAEWHWIEFDYQPDGTT